ncbi:MAG: pyridoxal-phosphate dependent enzyme [Microthrixaceae bacterium]
MSDDFPDLPSGITPSVLELIGDTPLVRLKRLSEEEGISATLAMKMETTNPGGSSKDRPALQMILEAEASGDLKPGGTIVEPTSGNTGVGLAIVAAQRGYRCIFVMTDKVAPEKVDLLRAYGAEVVVCPVAVPPEDPTSYYSVAEALVAETPNAYRPNQYANPSNPAAHVATTGPELWAQTDGRITHFVAGAGTCGTLTGVAIPQGTGPDDSGDRRRPRRLGVLRRLWPPLPGGGVGEDFFPDAWDEALYDEVIAVSDADSFSMARRVAAPRAFWWAAQAAWRWPRRFRWPTRPGPTTWWLCSTPTRGAATCRRCSTTTGWPSSGSPPRTGRRSPTRWSGPEEPESCSTSTHTTRSATRSR